MMKGVRGVKAFFLRQNEKIYSGNRKLQIEAVTELARFAHTSQIFFGARAITLLADAVSVPDMHPEARSFALEKIARIAHQPEMFLEKMTKEHPDKEVALQAAHWLAHLATQKNRKQAIDSLKRLYNHPDKRIRSLARWNTIGKHTIWEDFKFWVTGRWSGMDPSAEEYSKTEKFYG